MPGSLILDPVLPGVDSANRQLVIRRAAASRACTWVQYTMRVAQRPPVMPLLASLVSEKADVSDDLGPDVSRDPFSFETRGHNQSRKSSRYIS